MVGTIPVGILGVMLRASGAQTLRLAGAGGGVLVRQRPADVSRRALRRRQHAAAGRLEKLIVRPKRLWIGFAQSAALLPGISRSGISMVAGLLCDLDHEDAAHYSFLLGDAGDLGGGAFSKCPKLFAPGAHVVLVQAIVGGIAAGIAAYLFGRVSHAVFPLERPAPVRLVLRRRRRDLLLLGTHGSHFIVRTIAFVLAVVFFVVGILYGLGKINWLTESGAAARAPRHAPRRVLGAGAALSDLGALSRARLALTKPELTSRATAASRWSTSRRRRTRRAGRAPRRWCA